MFPSMGGMNPSYPSQGPPPPGGMPPPPATRGSSNPNYFTDKKKGEVNELKNLLREVTVEKDVKRKREIIKKVIAYMTLGIDVSRLFSEMVLCVDTKDLISKKMVYLYLTNYAQKNSELAIMCINTLLNDCRNEDPMVRGLALRSLCSLRLDSILEYIHDPLQASLTDTSAYVRKTGVIDHQGERHDRYPYNMIRDRDPQVVSNCIVALNEIMADEGGIAINQPIVMHLLSRISDFNEWGQCNILEIVAKYKPTGPDECLRVSNSAVVLGTAKCFFNLTQARGMEQIQDQVFERMRQPLLTLMAKPHVFSRDYRQFYNRYNEPTHVKYVKIDVLALVADGANVADIVTELSEYVTDVDQELARRAIRAIADIAMQDHIMDTMVDFLELDLDYVRDESLVVMKDLLRKYPDKRHDVLPVLGRIIAAVQQPTAKAAVVWMLGEFGQDLRRAPYVLEKLIDDFNDEAAPSVLLELLAATMKLFFKRPPEMQSMLGRLLGSAINESNHQDVRDRALLYYRLLEQQPTEQAAAIVAQFRSEETVSVFAESIETDLKDKLFQEFNSLAVVYNKPSELFVSSTHLPAHEVEEEEEEEDEGYDHTPPPPQQQRTSAAPPQPAAPSMDLLDMDFGSASSGPPPQAAGPSFALVPTPVMDAATFQGQWGSRPLVAEVVVQLPTLPPQNELEQAFASRGIVTMASGDVGPQYKFFFYAQDTQGRFFLSETLVEKANRTLRASIKARTRLRELSSLTSCVVFCSDDRVDRAATTVGGNL
ncbi:AP complex subunit beta [Phytophthora cactorum]|nr:AP complex subunit beta [Phytophthora cactorum]